MRREERPAPMTPSAVDNRPTLRRRGSRRKRSVAETVSERASAESTRERMRVNAGRAFRKGPVPTGTEAVGSRSPDARLRGRVAGA